MKLPVTTKDKIEKPLKEFGYAFIDAEDKKLKVKKYDSIIEFSNDLSDIELLDLTDYTAFEVYPTDHEIPAGSSELGSILNALDEDGAPLLVKNSIPASMTEEFSLWITKSRLESDIVIDWGDGSIEKLSELTPTSGTDNDGQINVLVYVAHTYEIPNKTYIIKIYGKDYCALRHNSYKLNKNNRLMCRCLTNDLPIASHLNNLASFAYNCKRLIEIKFSSYSNIFLQVINWSSVFYGCNNLKYATGFNMFYSTNAINNLFEGCNALIKTDFKFRALTFNGINGVFNGCSQLKMNILDLFSSKLNFGVNTVSVYNLFTNSSRLHLGYTEEEYISEQTKFNNNDENIFEEIKETLNQNAIALGKLLWNNKDINWDITSAGSKPFVGCSSLIKSRVPQSWGGTASDSIIEKSDKERIAELEAKIEELMNK